MRLVSLIIIPLVLSLASCRSSSRGNKDTSDTLGETPLPCTEEILNAAAGKSLPPEQDPRNYCIKDVSVKEVASNQAFTKKLEELLASGRSLDSISSADFGIELSKVPLNVVPAGRDQEDTGALEVVNTALRVWDVIKENRSTTSSMSMTANALPSGVQSPSELTDWSKPMVRTYEYSGNNVLGLRLFTVTYNIIHQYGGKYQGKGAYLAGITCIASNMDVVWGTQISMTVQDVTVSNIAKSGEEPLAYATMTVQLKSDNVGHANQMTKQFGFSGNKRSIDFTN